MIDGSIESTRVRENVTMVIFTEINPHGQECV